MSFLKSNPTVFVIGNDYEVVFSLKENGICSLLVGGETYYEENTGVLSSEKNYAKIRVPQKALDKTKEYTVKYRKSINRKAYFSELGDAEFESFAFCPIEKTDNINIYHSADVHYIFDVAKNTISYFGEDTDLIILNGDIGEVETEENYFDILNFTGEISGGKIPVVFARGNHDTRGRLAERYTDYFPANHKDTYYTFEIGNMRGIVLDCGEDKPDSCDSYGGDEYGGVNIFEIYRRRELKFLKSLEADKEKLTFAISHMCPAQIHDVPGSKFDIERELYSEYNRELARIGIKFMINGHIHRTYVLKKNDERSLLPHEYNVIIGSAWSKNDGKYEIAGTAINIKKNEINFKFTDSHHNVLEEYILDSKTEIIEKVN